MNRHYAIGFQNETPGHHSYVVKMNSEHHDRHMIDCQSRIGLAIDCHKRIELAKSPRMCKIVNSSKIVVSWSKIAVTVKNWPTLSRCNKNRFAKHLGNLVSAFSQVS